MSGWVGNRKFHKITAFILNSKYIDEDFGWDPVPFIKGGLRGRAWVLARIIYKERMRRQQKSFTDSGSTKSVGRLFGVTITVKCKILQLQRL